MTYVTWNRIKSKLETEGSLNKQYDLDADGLVENIRFKEVAELPDAPKDYEVVVYKNILKAYDPVKSRWCSIKTLIGYDGFDNNGGGAWTKYINIPITTIPSEYAQYRIEIDSTNVTVYSVDGTQKAQGAVASDFWANVKTDGSDIRVFDEAKSQLFFYIETFDPTNKQSTIKVRLLAGSTELNIAYGNPSAIESSYNNASYVYDYYSHFDTLPAGTLATYNSPDSADAYIDSSRLVVENYESSGITVSGAGYIIELNLPSADYRIEGHGFTSTHGTLGASLLGLEYEGDKVFNIKRWEHWISGSTSATKVLGGTTIGEIYVEDDFTYDVIGHEIVAICLLASSVDKATTYTYLDELKIYKLADPAEFGTPQVLSF